MINSKINRRQHPRYRLDASKRVPIHIFPVLPFLGEAIDAHLMNISATGIAIIANFAPAKSKIKKGSKIKIHFRLPGYPLSECVASVVRNTVLETDEHLLGLRFVKAPQSLTQAIEKCWKETGKNGVEIALQQID